MVNEVTFEWGEPGFQEHKNGEGDLNLGLPPVELVVNRVDKEGPPVLEVAIATMPIMPTPNWIQRVFPLSVSLCTAAELSSAIEVSFSCGSSLVAES